MTDERFFGRLGPVGTVPAAQSPDTLPDLAGSLNDLSVRLGEVGRWEDGLAAVARGTARGTARGREWGIGWWWSTTRAPPSDLGGLLAAAGGDGHIIFRGGVVATVIDERSAARAEQLWAALSQASHHHAYELTPTAAELRRWHDQACGMVSQLNAAS